MEMHKCKLCFKSFTNGRALGGHMRSHMLKLPVPPKFTEQERLPTIQLSQESESASYSLSSSDEEKGQFYGLRENPKRSVRMVDPEFVDAGSVVLQDRGSETESSKIPTRKRSKQTRRIQENHHHLEQPQHERKKLKVNYQASKTESWTEPEPVSSISDTTTEESVAFCLMMLSRDHWKTKVVVQDDDGDGDGDDDEDSMEESYKLSRVSYRTIRDKYKCETCNRVFKSYQALGGHKASHRKKPSAATHETENVATTTRTTTTTTSSSISMRDQKIHECPVCFRVFSSGQALGGHKRSHLITGQVAAAATTTIVKSSKKSGDSFIDLNLPAPIDDDDDASVSQIELSAVSDAEFVNHFKR